MTLGQTDSSYAETSRKRGVSMKDNYKEEVKVIEFSGMIARVHSPILTEGERNARMQAIHKATAELLRGVKQK